MSTRILALDTATEACSVALYNQGEITSLFEICPQTHTQRILPLVDQLLSDAGLTLQQLDALAFGHGPGSFTGVRIAIGIAQGLALGAELPLIGVSTLKTMAAGCQRQAHAQHVLAGIDARMGEIYLGCYQLDEDQQWQQRFPEAVLTPQQVIQQLAELKGEWFIAGSAWQAYPNLADQITAMAPDCQLILSNINFPSAEDMLPLALLDWQHGTLQEAATVEPTYLRNTVAWKKLPGRD